MRIVVGILLCCCLLSTGCAGAREIELAAEGSKWRTEGDFPVFQKRVIPEEDVAIGSPDVITINTSSGQRLFRMAYAQGGTDKKGRIGLAESSDGVAWKHIAPIGAVSVLEPSDEGAWDSWFLDTPALLYQDGVWYMWYFGANSNARPGGAIGLAKSTDGIHFTRVNSKPVLQSGSADEWDGLWVESPSVVYDGTQFVMYYTGVDKTWRPRTGRALSSDGITWVKDRSNPVLSNGNPGTWDSFAVAMSTVVYKDGCWELYYCSLSEQEASQGIRKPKIGKAVSKDGRNFSRSGTSPVITSGICGNAPDGPCNPSVLFDANAGCYYMWYETGVGFGLGMTEL